MDPAAYSADQLHLSDGRVILSWNGQAGYTNQDEVTGPIEVGSVLTSVTEGATYSGEKFNIYHFEDGAKYEKEYSDSYKERQLGREF